MIEYIYYFLAIFALAVEFSILNGNGAELVIKAKNHINNGGNIKDLPENDKTHSYARTIYTVWSFIGLFTSQWIIFLILFIMGAIPKGENKRFYQIDAVISIGLLMFILINKFHLHINLLQCLMEQ
jgi:hypothetical protein